MQMSRFSRTFERALDAILDISPEDKPMTKTAREFMDSVIQTSKDNPWFRDQQIVAVYQDSGQQRLMGLGRVTGMLWEEFYSAYEYDVLMKGETMRVLSSRLRDVAPDEARRFF